MTIYLDIIFLLNLLFNTLILFFTSYFRKKKINYYLLFIGGAIGASSVLLMFTSYASIVMNPFYKLFLSSVIVFVAFGRQTIGMYVKDLFAFYFITFLFGGIMFGIHYFFQFNADGFGAFLLGSSNSFGDPISWSVVIIGFIFAYYFSKKQIDSHEIVKLHYDQLIDCMVCIENEIFEFKALVDSGNHAQDTISAKPIHFLSYEIIKEKLPTYEMIASKGKDTLLNGETSKFLKDKKFTIVPYKVLGATTNIVIAFVPQWLAIKNEEGLQMLDNCYISLVDQQLSSEDSFFAILNPKSLALLKSR